MKWYNVLMICVLVAMLTFLTTIGFINPPPPEKDTYILTSEVTGLGYTDNGSMWIYIAIGQRYKLTPYDSHILVGKIYNFTIEETKTKGFPAIYNSKIINYSLANNAKFIK